MTGCGLFTVTKYKTVLVVPEDDQLVDCVINPPPERAAVERANLVERSEIHADAWLDQTGSLIKCNDRWGSLREWKRRQIEAAKENEQDTDIRWCVTDC